jgi:hypothetical protein
MISLAIIPANAPCSDNYITLSRGSQFTGSDKLQTQYSKVELTDEGGVRTGRKVTMETANGNAVLLLTKA